MPYGAVADIQKHRPHHPITAGSKPTIDQVTEMIASLSAAVDGQLAALGFLIPVTGPESVKYLKSAVGFGVAGLIETAQRAGIAGGGEKSEVRSALWAIYEAMIKAVVETPAILSDAARSTADDAKGAGGSPVMESFFTRHPADDADTGMRGKLAGSAVPRFEMRQEF